MISLDNIKKLRAITNVGYLECKEALVNSNGDFDKALEYLRISNFKDKGDYKFRDLNHGIIEVYVHIGNRIASMVEIRCETDFVAKTKEIKEFAKNIALQVSALSPKYISRKDVPREDIQDYTKIITDKWMKGAKFANELEEHVKESLNKWFGETCLLEQFYIKDHSLTIEDLLNSLTNLVKENCNISRFQRWEV